MQNQGVRGLVGFVWGVGLFFVVGYSLKYALGGTTLSPALSQVVLKATLIVVAVAIWKLLGRPLREMGFQRGWPWNRSYILWFAIAGVAMVAASVIMIFLEVQHPLAAQLSFLQVVTIIFLLSSFSEEIYVRGLVQSWVANGDGGIHSAFAPSIIASACVFAGIHVPLIWTPAGLKGGLTLVATMLVLGWVCAVLRTRSQSLWPAIAAHIFGNFSGVPGAFVGVILYRLCYGHFPEFLTRHLTN